MFNKYYNQFFKNSTLVNRILIVNAAIFLLVNLVGIFIKLSGLSGQGSGLLVHYLSASSDFKSTLLRPWSIVTYQFTHVGFLHILFNLIIFNFVGQIFAGTLGEKRLLPLYLIGGFFGWLLYALLYTLSPVFPAGDNEIIGASASIMAVMAAAATYLPEYKLRILTFQISLKWIAIIYIAGDLVAVNNLSQNVGGSLAHLGGAAFGFFYSLQLKKGNDYSVALARIIDQLSAWLAGTPKPKRRAKMKTYRNTSRKKTTTIKNKSSNEKDTVDQEEIDRILDKISQSGYDSLSSSEKATLFKASNN